MSKANEKHRHFGRGADALALPPPTNLDAAGPAEESGYSWARQWKDMIKNGIPSENLLEMEDFKWKIMEHHYFFSGKPMRHDLITFQ